MVMTDGNYRGIRGGGGYAVYWILYPEKRQVLALENGFVQEPITLEKNLTQNQLTRLPRYHHGKIQHTVCRIEGSKIGVHHPRNQMEDPRMNAGMQP